MFLGQSSRIDAACLDDAIGALTDTPAVFLIWPREGSPYLARTGMLRRRLKRLLAKRDSPSRVLNLRDIASHVEYWSTASRLASSLMFYEAARAHFPNDYPKLIKLRFPAYVRLMLSDPFPRFQTTSRVAASRDYYYGPFRTRAEGEEFERQCLDLFQIRRCPDDLSPSPSHPGCIYGEMNLCLRPCQEVVTREEYASETVRVVEFLASGGRSLLDVIAAARDRLSEEMAYEAAAREHARLESIGQMLKSRGELAAPIESLSGVAVQASPHPDNVELWFMLGGIWLPPVRFPLQTGGAMSPLDIRIRDVVTSLAAPALARKEREEHLALLARWFYSSWRDGVWLSFDSLEHVPYKRLGRAISKVASAYPLS